MLCSLWDQIDPWNVWDLPYSVWLMFREATDAYVEQQKNDKR